MESSYMHAPTGDKTTSRSARERTIRHLINDGWSVRQICLKLECSPSLVRRLRAESFLRQSV
jgi:DNA-binding NarL/FixJ family response regulator